MSSRGFAEAYEWTVDLAEQNPHENTFLHQRFISPMTTNPWTIKIIEKDPNLDWQSFIERKQFKKNSIGKSQPRL